MAIGIAVERSASSRMMLGDLPPSSSVNAHCVQEFLATSFPICVEPVKAISEVGLSLLRPDNLPSPSRH